MQKIRMRRGLNPGQWLSRPLFIHNYVEIAPDLWIAKFSQARTGKGVQYYGLFERVDGDPSSVHQKHERFEEVATLKRNRNHWSGKVMKLFAIRTVSVPKYDRIVIDGFWPDEDKYLPLALDALFQSAAQLGLNSPYLRHVGAAMEMLDNAQNDGDA